MIDKSKIPYAACGTRPINHDLMFVLSFLDEATEKLHNLTLSLSDTAAFQKIGRIIEKGLFGTLHFLRIVKYNKNDVEKAVTGRSKIIWEEAMKRGIPMEQVVALGKPLDIYRATINGKIFYFNSLPVPPHLPQKGYSWIDNKFILGEKLREIGRAHV